VSSIRLFILDSLAERPMHGHQLRLLAEQEHVARWTDFAVGAVYGALKRLAAEGLIEEIRTERSGNYPERQVYGVTSAGRAALDEVRESALGTVVFRPDPFDLALARLDPDRLDELESRLADRIEVLQKKYAETESHLAAIGKHLTVAESIVMRHTLARLRTEIDWHEDVLQHRHDIIADELTKERFHG
jgi:DNA-binding PadR family transcriptional regulator